MSDYSRTPGRRYGVAVAAIVFTMALRMALRVWVEGSSPYLFFIPAVMLSAWYGGRGPGALATAVGGIVSHFC